MNLPVSRLRPLRAACILALLSVAASATLADEALTNIDSPDNPIASTRVPDGTTTITQTREQNAVTSVRVQRGGNVYQVTPTEQIPYYEEGSGRAATWEIFQFRSGSSSGKKALPPPQR